MAIHRRKDLLSSRRRAKDEGEEHSGPEDPELDDDSLSDASALSDLEDDDADGEGSDISEQDPELPPSNPPGSGANGHTKHQKPIKGVEETVNGNHGAEHAPAPPAQHALVTARPSDTDTMLNSLALPEKRDDAEEIDFEDMGNTDEVQANGRLAPTDQTVEPSGESLYEKRRREQEEYRKKRDADPTFVPNRGGFFMHDHRHAGPAANGFRPFGRGRGRGRGAVGGPYSPANQPSPSVEPANAPWAHDLHESVVQPQHNGPGGDGVPNGSSAKSGPKPSPMPAPQNRSFSKSTHIGNVQIRVFLAGMKEPITFSAVPVKQHTRLPHHRPPLRRDKPVRISIPHAPPRYIFPATERSFIFIPRALRPNQQGYGRPGGRGNYTPYRGFSSRRTSTYGASAYGGSTYSPSVAMSRRSSLAQEVTRDSVISPTGSTISQANIPVEQGKPVVRLPPSAHRVQQHPHVHGPAQIGMMPLQPVPVVSLPPLHSYPPPQDPTYRENRSGPIPMHQPRPQKAVSVADIESPEKVTYPPPQQQQQQPFFHQVPNQANGQTYPQDPSYNPHSRNASYPSQPSTGTPLSQIPERAIHAQPFQPPQYQQAYYPHPYQGLPAQGAYFYPPPGSQTQYPPVIASAPMFVPHPQHPPYPMAVASAPPTATAVSTAPPQPTGQGNTVAQESNGMVYYYDSSQLAGSGYQAVGYPVGQVGGPAGLAGPLTPSPDGYYYPQPGPGAIYYG